METTTTYCLAPLSEDELDTIRLALAILKRQAADKAKTAKSDYDFEAETYYSEISADATSLYNKIDKTRKLSIPVE